MYYKYVELPKSVNLRKQGIDKKVRALWALRNVQRTMDKAIMTQCSERQI